MAETQAGVQVPPDSTGKQLGAFPLIDNQDGSVVWVGATVLVDANGIEIGHQLLRAVEGLRDDLARVGERVELEGVKIA